jgi:hypothetical protein
MSRSAGISARWRFGLLFLAALLAVMALRSLWSFPTEHGDSVQQFFWAARIVETGDWSALLTNHHTARWAAMLPQIGLTALVGTRYEAFYLLPLLMFSAGFLVALQGMKPLLNGAFLLLLAAVLFFEPTWLLTSNAFLITGLGTLFALLGSTVLARSEAEAWPPVILAGVLFFVAYGAHVSYLSFAAGGLCWLLLCRRSWRQAVLFAGVIGVLLIVEILAFNALSDGDYMLGRWDVLLDGTHLQRVQGVYETVVFSQLLTRWLDLPLPDFLMCLAFLAAAPLVFRRDLGNDGGIAFLRCTWLTGFFFAFAATFAVVELDPIRPMMPLQVRHLMPFIPFAAMMSLYLASRVSTLLLGSSRRRVEWTASLALTVSLAIIPTLFIDYYREKFKAFAWQADREYREFSERFREGELILTGKRKAVYRLIAIYRHPFPTQQTGSRINALQLRPDALCVGQLNRTPLERNYEPCR